jgi:hypothetical protein
MGDAGQTTRPVGACFERWQGILVRLILLR